ncbi:hypothetical protein OGATHE_005752 [Ogataea polymorpha]|uniref:Uncharacterized protein n=1 Tax=Ogataea polymorpha TaxID=460523 RepID=A0A9P8NUP9_9ASCO|nr:hypothetical protein OGATHE_005752 [Ogataea polymorpha]
MSSNADTSISAMSSSSSSSSSLSSGAGRYLTLSGFISLTLTWPSSWSSSVPLVLSSTIDDRDVAADDE